MRKLIKHWLGIVLDKKMCDRCRKFLTHSGFYGVAFTTLKFCSSRCRKNYLKEKS